jgi:ABC-type nitrate/sulfonate/bicarbonate transport system permease component
MILWLGIGETPKVVMIALGRDRTGKLMVGLATLLLLGLASTWGLRALEAWLAPWKEEGQG